MNKLIDIPNKLNELSECFYEIISTIEDINVECDRQWEAVNIYLRRLLAIRTALDGAMPKELDTAIDEAIEEHERLSDLADAQNY
jgi:hypothetical protein